METLRSTRARFGVFELDLKAGELHKGDRTLVLQEQPFQVLQMLVEHRGELVSREEIQKKLWPNDTVVEFDHAINTAIKKLRQALADSAENPKYIETVARRGYRLMMPVEWAEASPARPDLAVGARPPHADPGSGNLIGKKVSHYRVLEILGGGGMGVVYRAEDLKLGRRVALKFLPEDLGKDSKTVERFEREARAASALDHPNICTIHEFGEHEGQPFIVMQLLDGQSLRDRIAEKDASLTIDKVLYLAVQIADGLEAAHQKGIIHRDIKPANIFITKRGEAKILDFGLAKLAHANDLETGQGMPEPPATDVTLTRTGAALGTAAYMSPEQVRGEKLDARTDLFSFGLVLYEMATGQQAFPGDSVPILHDAILNHTPTAPRELKFELPPKLEAVIDTALQKDRDLRYQSASQMSADLRRLQPYAQKGPHFRRWSLTVAGLFLMFLVVAAFWWFARHQEKSVSPPKLKQRQLTANSVENAVSTGAISPDGEYLAYADLKGIHVKRIETGETENLPQPPELQGVQVNWGIVDTWVSNTRLIANANIPGRPSTIWAISLVGEAPSKIRTDATAWAVSKDGSWVAFVPSLDREMWIMRPDGAQARKLYQADPNNIFLGAEFSPDGQRLAYYKFHEADNRFQYSIETRGLKGGPPTTVVPSKVDDWVWSPDGRMIYSLDEPGPTSESCNFWAVGIDAHTGKTIEKPKRLTDWAGFCMDIPSLSANGKRLTFRRWSWQANVYIADLEADGTRLTTPKRLTLNEGRNYPAAWTGDSKAVVFVSYRDAQWRILKQHLNEDTTETIATGVAGDAVFAGRVSPDGAWVFYFVPLNEASSSRDVTVRLMRIPIIGGPAEQVLTARVPTYGAVNDPLCARSPATSCVIVEQTPDRKQLIFTAFSPVEGRGRELARYDIDNGHAYCWDLSPDGSRIAVFKYSEERIHVLHTDGQASQAIAVKGWNSFQSVHWAADGKGLFVSSPTPQGSVLLHVDLKGNAHEVWRQQGSIAPWGGPWDMYMGSPSAPWAVASPDGRHLAIYTWSLSANMWMMENF